MPDLTITSVTLPTSTRSMALQLCGAMHSSEACSCRDRSRMACAIASLLLLTAVITSTAWVAGMQWRTVELHTFQGSLAFASCIQAVVMRRAPMLQL